MLGGAVERNRIKRRLREAVRLRRSVLEGAGAVDVVINPKKSVLTLEFSVVLEEVGRALDAIAKKHGGEMKSLALWLLRALQAVDFAGVSAVVPLRADLFGIRDGSGRAVWRGARRDDGGLAGVAVPSVGEGRAGSGGEGCVAEAHSFRKVRGSRVGHPTAVRALIATDRNDELLIWLNLTILNKNPGWSAGCCWCLR